MKKKQKVEFKKSFKLYRQISSKVYTKVGINFVHFAWMGEAQLFNQEEELFFTFQRERKVMARARIEYAESISSLSSQQTSNFNRVYRNQLQPFNPADKQG